MEPDVEHYMNKKYNLWREDKLVINLNASYNIAVKYRKHIKLKYKKKVTKKYNYRKRF